MLDLRCYTCDKDLHLVVDYDSDLFCSKECNATLPLSADLTNCLKDLIAERRYDVTALEVADAMLSWKPNPNKRRGSVDGILSIQWRTLRLQQLQGA